jgi:hypothetical protein
MDNAITTAGLYKMSPLRFPLIITYYLFVPHCYTTYMTSSRLFKTTQAVTELTNYRHCCVHDPKGFHNEDKHDFLVFSFFSFLPGNQL